MPCGNPFFADERVSRAQQDLRQQIADLLVDRIEPITGDVLATFPHSGMETVDADYCRRIGRQVVQLLAVSVREGRVDSRESLLADLHGLVVDRALSVERLFAFAYLIERTALDELAVHERIGVTSEPWPLVAQLVRRASFDYLAAYIERTRANVDGAPITDSLTTLQTRALFDAVLAKEIERASRFGYPVSLILLDVDHFSVINDEYGYGVGDRLLERLGILVRHYFRHHDWVARYAGDSIAVLLPRTEPDHATQLTERLQRTVSERLAFVDHRTERPVPVTVSAAIVNLAIAVGDIIDPERLMAAAEGAIGRAKRQGRNRIERVDGYSGPSTHTSP
jgi:diguanylate cyclase (GGDEF)-like protein